MKTSSPTSTIAAARCAVTDSPELLSRTVSRPSHAWNPTSATAPSDGQRRLGRSRWSRTATKREAEDDEADHRGDGSVDPLDPGLVIVERRDQLAVAERPIRAAHAGIGRADDDADRHEHERHRDGEHRQFLEPGQGALPGVAAGAAPFGSEGARPFYRERPSVLTSASGGVHRYPIGHEPPNQIGRDAGRPVPRRRLWSVGTSRVAVADPRRQRVGGRASFPTIISRELITGPNRIVFSFLDAERHQAGRCAGPHRNRPVHWPRR